MKYFYLALITLFIIQCKPETKEVEQDDEETTASVSEEKDSTPKVTGIGGVFFFSDAPTETKEWYAKNLGIEVDEYGSMFTARNFDNPEIVQRLQWSLFNSDSKYFKPSEKDFMINYTVQNIEALVEKLKENGVTVLDTIENYEEYGKFVHIMDEEGNKIELWEPSEEKESF